jgi:hypothetical protein
MKNSLSFHPTLLYYGCGESYARAPVAGNIFPLLAYPLNACNGFLVTILIQSAKGASSLPFASVRTPGVPLLLVGLFYAGCVPR